MCNIMYVCMYEYSQQLFLFIENVPLKIKSMQEILTIFFQPMCLRLWVAVGSTRDVAVSSQQ